MLKVHKVCTLYKSPINMHPQVEEEIVLVLKMNESEEMKAFAAANHCFSPSTACDSKPGRADTQCLNEKFL